MAVIFNTSPSPLLKTGILPRTGGTYGLILQSVDDIPHILALQQILLDEQAVNRRNFLLPRDMDFYQRHFAEGGMMLGVVHDAKLIAQSIIVHPHAGMTQAGMTTTRARPEEVSALQGVAVHPQFRGNRLMHAMIETWLDIAAQAGRTHVMARTAVSNYQSWNTFLQEGLYIGAISPGKSDDGLRYDLESPMHALMKRRMKGGFNTVSIRNALYIPATDLDRQQNILAHGARGIIFDQGSQSRGFMQHKTVHAPRITQVA